MMGVNPLWWMVSLPEHERDENAIPEDVYERVLTRDMYMCMHCGNEDRDALHLHHAVYRSRGGKHEDDNLVTICFRCHREIHDGLLYVTNINDCWYFSLSKWRKSWQKHLQQKKLQTLKS
jgi:hypothetical protein